MLHTLKVRVHSDLGNFLKSPEVELNSKVVVIDIPASLVLNVHVLDNFLESGRRVVLKSLLAMRRSLKERDFEEVIYLDVRVHSMFGMNLSSLDSYSGDIVMCLLLGLILRFVMVDAEAQKALLGNVGGGHLAGFVVDAIWS